MSFLSYFIFGLLIGLTGRTYLAPPHNEIFFLVPIIVAGSGSYAAVEASLYLGLIDGTRASQGLAGLAGSIATMVIWSILSHRSHQD